MERGRVVGGQFRLLRQIETGQGVETWAGEDLRSRQAMAIKIAERSAIPPAVAERLRREAMQLREVDAEAADTALHLGTDDGSAFVAAPWIPGRSLRERLRQGPLSLAESLALAQRLLEALAAVHARGVVHRHIKPSDVLLEHGHPQRAVLVDFGLARIPHGDIPPHEQPLEAIRYASPEQLGFLPSPVDARSDLYAIGAIWFECLAGRPLFDANSSLELARQHVTGRVPQLRQLGLSVPRAVDQILQHLLQIDPSDRYQSAEGALVDLAALQATGGAARELGIVPGLADRRRVLTEPAFVGRDETLEALEAELHRTRTETGALLLLEAESGGGKTRLIAELERRVAGSVWILTGSAAADVAHRPFEMLTGVVTGIIHRAQLDRGWANQFRQALGEHAAAATAAFPQLGDVLMTVDRPTGPAEFGERRTLRALGAMLGALGTDARPALVCLDDCQWADAATLKLLAYWERGKDEPGAARVRRTAVLATLRSDETPEDHPLRSLPDAHRIALQPLSSHDIRLLVESMAGPLPDEAVDLVRELCGGSPLMASAILHGMVERGLLTAGPSGWQANRTAMEHVRASGQAAVVLSARLDLLPPDVLELLSLGSVVGPRFDLDLAATLAGRTPDQARAAAEQARRRHLVWQDRQAHRCSFVHDKVREALLERLPGGLRITAHSRIADLLIARDPTQVFDIAYHLDAAGQARRAVPFALAAAEEARARYALGTAELQYRIARRGATGAGRATRRRIAEGLGEVLSLEGRYEAALPEYECALALAETEFDRARLECQLGDLKFKLSDLVGASGALERGLALLGRPGLPRRRLPLLLALLGQVLIQALHTLLPRVFLARRSPAGAEDDFLAMRIYSRLAHVSWFQRGPIATMLVHLREMNLAERYPLSEALAQAYSEHAPAMAAVPWYRRGIAYAQKSADIGRRLDDLWRQGQSHHFYALVLGYASRLEESVEHCRRSIRLLGRTGDRWEAELVRRQLAWSLYRLGDLRSATELAKRSYHTAVELGDRQSGLMIWSCATGGNVPGELVQAALASPSADAVTRSLVWLAKGVRCLALNQLDDAVAALERGQSLVDDKGLRTDYTAAILPWLATALRMRLEQQSAYAAAAEAPRRRVRHARAVVSRAVRMARKYRNNLPHALRERALIAALAGRPGRARRWIDRSVEVARSLSMRHEEGLSLVARAQLSSALGWSGAAADRAEGDRILATTAAPEQHARPDPEVPLALAERLDTLLETGRRIASGLSKAAIHAAVHEGGKALLRAEQAAVVEVTDAGDLQLVAGDLSPDPALLRRTIEAGEPLLLGGGSSHALTEGLIRAGVRVALCSPILVRGRVAALLYASHRQAGHIFGDFEARLARFIGALAGAALENAAGFAKIEALSEERGRLYDQAQESVRARDRFLAIASHELRTPLTPLNLHLQALLRRLHRGQTTPPAECADRLERTVQHLQQLAGQIDRLLDVSRITGGRLALHPDEVDLTEVVQAAVEAHRAELERSGSPIDISTHGSIRGFWDRLRLEQIASNLISNAIKFGAGRPIDVALEADDEVARLQIRDHGIGIAPQDVERIFHRFERAVSERHYGGFGFGLWIVRQITEAHGGRIDVESQPGRGSTFTVRLPRRRPTVRPRPNTWRPALPGQDRPHGQL